MKRAIQILLVLFTASVYGVDIEQVQKHTTVVKAITKAATRVGVPVELMLSIAWVESSYRASLPPSLDGATPSYGVFQVKLETALWLDEVYKHKRLATPERLSNTYINSFYAAKYIKLLLKRYNGNVEMAIDAYNKGHVVSTKSTYVKRVQEAMK